MKKGIKYGPTYKTINKVITRWYFGTKIPEGASDCLDFDVDLPLLMRAVTKMVDNGYWYAVFPSEIRTYIHPRTSKTTPGYKVAFTEKSYGRMGYGDKFTAQVFQRDTIHKALWYSLYRLIKFGKEY